VSGGVLTFHPTIDLYSAYKTLRAADESIRPYNPFLRADGNLPKGAGKYTPRFTMLLEGTKVVIPANATTVNVTGELLTDDGSTPFDMSLIAGPCTVNYQPAEAEIIKVTASGNEYSLEQIAAAVLAQAQVTPIHSDAPSAAGIADSVANHAKMLTVGKFLAMKD